MCWKLPAPLPPDLGPLSFSRARGCEGQPPLPWNVGPRKLGALGGAPARGQPLCLRLWRVRRELVPSAPCGDAGVACPVRVSPAAGGRCSWLPPRAEPCKSRLLAGSPQAGGAGGGVTVPTGLVSQGPATPLPPGLGTYLPSGGLSPLLPVNLPCPRGFLFLTAGGGPWPCPLLLPQTPGPCPPRPSAGLTSFK